MNITFPPYPLPVVVEGLGDAYIIYLKCGAMWENDEACISLKDGGRWYHVTTDRIRSFHNTTYNIIKAETK